MKKNWDGREEEGGKRRGTETEGGKQFVSVDRRGKQKGNPL